MSASERLSPLGRERTFASARKTSEYVLDTHRWQLEQWKYRTRAPLPRCVVIFTPQCVHSTSTSSNVVQLACRRAFNERPPL